MAEPEAKITEYDLRLLVGVNLSAQMQGQKNFVNNVVELESVDEAILTTGPFPGIIVVTKELEGKFDHTNEVVNEIQSLGVRSGVPIGTTTGYLLADIVKDSYQPTSLLFGINTGRKIDGQIEVAERLIDDIPYIKRTLITAGSYPDIVAFTDGEKYGSKKLISILREIQEVPGVTGTSTGSFVYLKKNNGRGP